MCEFNVLLDGNIVFKDATYAKAERKHVEVRGVLGDSQTFVNCKIVEVDVGSERLVLASIDS